MKIAIVGLWHLGCVYSASLASLNHSIVAIDEDPVRISLLQDGGIPVEEPSLSELIHAGVLAGNLRFSADLSEVAQAHIVWITVDTPVRDDDTADSNSVIALIERVSQLVKDNTIIVISSQLPLGSSRHIKNTIAERRPSSNIDIAYSPENLRLGSAINAFRYPDRIIIGTSSSKAVETLSTVLAPLEVPIISMSLESAELTKHALNSFLAMSVAFANEIARIAEVTNADARDVAKALKSDPRIGSRAYVAPGGPIAGGTLARDIRYLEKIADQANIVLPVVNAIMSSHSEQQQWPVRAITKLLKPGDGRVLILGIAYKSGTSTLRRSFGIDTATRLHSIGYDVAILDALAEDLPSQLSHFKRFNDLSSAASESSAIIICGPEASISKIPEVLEETQKKFFVLDAIGAISGSLGNNVAEYIYSPGKGVAL